METREETIKHREIRFCSLHPDSGQAHSASLVLADLEGVVSVDPHDPHHLQIRYDLTLISLNLLEGVLIELGYHLDNSLMMKLRRALYYFTEETERANLGLETAGLNDRQIHINRYLKLRHGCCRDERPEHWRNYL